MVYSSHCINYLCMVSYNVLVESGDKMNPEVLRKMRFNPSGHNSIYTDHLETITDTLEEICPIESKKCLLIVGASVGMSDRFVKEHIRRLEACDVIRKVKGEYIWNIGVKEKVKKEEEKQEAPTIETGDIKPCRYRPVSGDCNPGPNKIVVVNAQNCNVCKQREE